MWTCVVQGGILCPMSKTSDSKIKVRLEPEMHDKLVKLQSQCPFNPSLGTLANEAIMFGLPKLTKVCNSTKTKHAK